MTSSLVRANGAGHSEACAANGDFEALWSLESVTGLYLLSGKARQRMAVARASNVNTIKCFAPSRQVTCLHGQEMDENSWCEHMLCAS